MKANKYERNIYDYRIKRTCDINLINLLILHFDFIKMYPVIITKISTTTFPVLEK